MTPRKPQFTLAHIVWWTCNGDAHKNPFIDHCMVCLPYWEQVPTCHICGGKLTSGISYYRCPACKHKYMHQEVAYGGN